MTGVARIGVLVALGIGAAACGGLAVVELPTEPLAFVRQEEKEGIASLDEFMAAVQMDVRDKDEEREAVRSARTSVMLLDPQTLHMQEVPDAGHGSLPLDWSHDGLHLLIGRRPGGGSDLQLFSWNRLTGAYSRLIPDRTLGSAAFANGPIRLARTGRIMGVGAARQGLFLTVDDQGTLPLKEGLGGTEPDITPDGLSVVFVRFSGRGPDGTILLSRLGEEQVQPLARGRTPRLSRDGRWIAYTTHRKGNADVWLMRADGSGKRPVTTSSFDEIFPAVSPNGRYVVYASARGDEQQSQLYVARVRDRLERQLTQSGQNGRPVW
jgi:hypothetical protein